MKNGKMVHLVRGDSATATLTSAGIRKDDLVTCHDSLSWGPVSEGDIDLLRAGFWSSLGIPVSSDYALISRAISRSGASHAVWPESFLDGTLFAIWTIVTLSKGEVPSDRILVPSTLRDGSLYIGDSPANVVADAQLIAIDELIGRDRLFSLWGAVVSGRIDELHSQVAGLVADGSRWLLPLQDFVDRIPNWPKQLPPMVEELLEDLANQNEAQPISRVVGRMLLRRHRKTGMLDTDTIVFRLVRELAAPPNSLIEIRKTAEKEYPIAHSVELSTAGRRVLESGAPFKIGSSSPLRWIGGLDQVRTPVSFDASSGRFRWLKG